MEEKKFVEQELKAEVRELSEPEMEKVVGGAEGARSKIKDTDFASETVASGEKAILGFGAPAIIR